MHWGIDGVNNKMQTFPQPQNAAEVKGDVTQAIFPAICNATDKSIVRHITEFMLHAATYLAMLGKVEALSTFPATCNFSLRDMLQREGCCTQFC